VEQSDISPTGPSQLKWKGKSFSGVERSDISPASTRARPTCAPSPLPKGLYDFGGKDTLKQCGAQRQK